MTAIDLSATERRQNAALLSAPLTGVEAVTKSDANELTNVSRALWVETTAGAVAMVMLDGTEVIVTLEKQKLYPFRVKQVKSTGTDAVGIKSFY